ncbi:MAG: potassium efflux system protein [Planctomycetota bacterium]|jgi:potassium efflux system protein
MSKLLVAGSLAAMFALPANSQDAVTPTVEQVQARLQATKEGSSENQESLVEAYQQTLAALSRAADARRTSQQFAADAAEAPALLETLTEELANPPAKPDLKSDESLGLKELESRLEQAQAELEASRAKLAELETTAEHRTTRKAALPEEIAAAQQNLSSAQEGLAALPAGAENEARRTLLLAQVDEFDATARALQTERDTYEARRELLPLRRDRALRRVTRAEQVATSWKELADTRRAEEGEAAARNAEEQQEDITRSFPLLERLATQTRVLAARRSGESGLPRRISRAQADLESARVQLEEVRSRFRAARRRIKAGGLTEGMGLILRWDYEWLPQVPNLRADSVARENLLSAAQLELIVIEEHRGAAGDIVTATDRLLLSISPSPSEQLRAAARRLLTTQRASRDALLDDLETLAGTFYAHKELASTLVAESLLYRQYIENRILWVRSSPSNPVNSVLAAPSHVAELARILVSRSTLQSLKDYATKRWGRATALGLLLVTLLALRPLLKRKRGEMGVYVRSFRTDKFSYTARALVESFLLALPMPLGMWTLGWLLTGVTDATEELACAAGGGFREIALVWLVLRFLRELATDRGVGSVHFKWPASSLMALRGELRWFEPIAVTLGLVALALDRVGPGGGTLTDPLTLDLQSPIAWSDSVGRLCFVSVMAALALFAHRLLRAESQMWAFSPLAGKGLLWKTHSIWSILASGLPVALALLAIAGYYYTALQFELRLRYSFGFAIALVMVNALLLRWLFMTRRRLAVRQALEAKARREQEEEAEIEGATESSTATLDADMVDIPSIDAQTRQLFKTSITLATVVGLYFIWASVLPALRGLDRVQILPSLAFVSVETDVASQKVILPATSGMSAASSSTPSIPGALPLAAEAPADGTTNALGLPAKLTLADVLLALVFVLLTAVAAKNLPAFLELAVLQRLPLDGGSRYAVSTIVRYFILIVGVTVVSGAVGVGWEKVQWLAAALTFGLAFGLQEIFANFISGLIILIERPIRVGDIVTVGETEGRVTQLRMRATTILDWDRREFLVPNKEFITGSVINWTLSDPVTRIIIPVGIAYGSDTPKARQLLLEAAGKNPLVLDDPAPSAIFRSFGASSLDFELRVFIANRDLWPELIDKIHSQIDDAFRNAGIEIAFPQRDLHIRSTNGLRDVRLTPEEKAHSPKP